MRIPGFRAGKVPRKVLEKQFGDGYARSEAIQTALPEFYAKAVREHDVDVIAQPEIDITGGEERGRSASTPSSRSDPRSRSSATTTSGSRCPSPHPTDDDIADQIDRLRRQYGEISDRRAPRRRRRLRLDRHLRHPRRRARRRAHRRRLPLRGRLRHRRGRARRRAARARRSATSSSSTPTTPTPTRTTSTSGCSSRRSRSACCPT